MDIHNWCVGVDYWPVELANIYTARKRSLGQGNILSSVCQGFCPLGGGGMGVGGAGPGGLM